MDEARAYVDAVDSQPERPSPLSDFALLLVGHQVRAHEGDVFTP